MRVTIDLPDDAFNWLEVPPEQYGAALRLAAAMFWYDKQRISQGKGSGIAGLDRTAFILALAENEVDVVQFTTEQLKKELEWLKHQSPAPRR